jgi:hypothetical protein
MRGPYYNSLVDAFQMGKDDTITFIYNRTTNLFDVKVVSDDGQRMPWAGFPSKFILVLIIF